MKTRIDKLLISTFIFCTLMTTSVFAANECRITYSWNTGNTFNGTFKNHSKKIYINKGQTKNINKNRMNYVKNLKSRQVKFFLTGSGATNVTLTKNQRNPAIGNYIGTPKLVKVKCLNSSNSTNNQPQTPAFMVNSMKASGASLNAITMALKNTFNLQNLQTAQHLVNAGFRVKDVGKVLKQLLFLDVEDLARVFKALAIRLDENAADLLKFAGYSYSQIASALKSVYNATSTQVARALKTAGYSVNQIASAVKTIYNATATEVAKALKAAGYSINQIASAVKTTYSPTTNEMSKALKAAGFRLGQIVSTMKKNLNYTRQQVELALQQTGYAANQIHDALNRSFGPITVKNQRQLK